MQCSPRRAEEGHSNALCGRVIPFADAEAHRRKEVLLSGVATAVPPHSIAQRDAAQAAEAVFPHPRGSGLVKAMYLRSGVERRQSVLLEGPDETGRQQQSFYKNAAGSDDHGPTTLKRMQCYEQWSGRLALDAARQSLQRANVSPAAVTHLVSVSCTGFHAPGFDLALIDQLQLRRDVSRTHVGFMGCHGVMNALRVAGAFAQTDPEVCVLVCAVELCSLHHQYSHDSQQIVANSLFSDGAAAAIVTSGASASGLAAANGCRDASRRLLDQTSSLVPQTADAMTWRIADHGFEMTLSPRVPDLIKLELRPRLADFLDRHGLTVESVGGWAIHPGGPRILSACGEALGLSPAQLAASRKVLAAHGNMSSPTVLFILRELMQQGAAGPWMTLAFGPGLTIEAALLGPPR